MISKLIQSLALPLAIAQQDMPAFDQDPQFGVDPDMEFDP